MASLLSLNHPLSFQLLRNSKKAVSLFKLLHFVNKYLCLPRDCWSHCSFGLDLGCYLAVAFPFELEAMNLSVRLDLFILRSRPSGMFLELFFALKIKLQMFRFCILYP